ncbi:hypothetical protein CMU25_18515 [Elizabethkingia anophelis]|nr:hypothetical protein [Elizabethkingia anophelis]MDV3842312.1 hypothetical protein [Elizabethkingia anophelis]
MIKYLLVNIFLLFSFKIYGQESLSGTIVSDLGGSLSNVHIYNNQSGAKTISDSDGKYEISAKPGDELVFIREGFDVLRKTVNSSFFSAPLNIILVKSLIEIKEVRLYPFSSKNFNPSNSKSFLLNSKVNEAINLSHKEITPYLKTPEMFTSKKINLHSIGYTFDIGKGDVHEKWTVYDLAFWLKKELGDNYFLSMGIKKEKIISFILYALKGYNNKSLYKNGSVEIEDFGVIKGILEEKCIFYIELSK